LEKVNLLLIVDDYLPHSTKVAAKMMHELGVGFSNAGHNVTLLTPRPSSIISSLFEQYRKLKLEKVEDISVIRFPSGRIKNVNKIFRLINEILLPCRAWNYAKRYLASTHFDLVVDYSPSIFWVPLVEKIKKQQNCKSYLILRDFFPQWAIDARIIQENSLLTKYFQFVEQKNYSIADKIGIQSPGNIEIFLRKNSKWKDKIQLLYNWADTNKEISIASDKTSSFRQRFNLEGKVVFFYGGNIGKAQEMMNLLVLADRMFHYSKDAFFIFLGEGDEVTVVKNYIATKKLTNSLYLPSVNQLEFQEILKSIDVGLFSLHPNHTSHNFPGKLLGYMQNAKPILGCVNKGNDLYETVSKSNSGYISYSGDIDALFSNAIKLMNQEQRIKLGQNSYQLLLDQFSTESAVSTILKIIQ
jgi:glycosyltransferase involved in cell wall biosynthesis